MKKNSLTITLAILLILYGLALVTAFMAHNEPASA